MDGRGRSAFTLTKRTCCNFFFAWLLRRVVRTLTACSIWPSVKFVSEESNLWEWFFHSSQIIFFTFPMCNWCFQTFACFCAEFSSNFLCSEAKTRCRRYSDVIVLACWASIHRGRFVCSVKCLRTVKLWSQVESCYSSCADAAEKNDSRKFRKNVHFLSKKKTCRSVKSAVRTFFSPLCWCGAFLFWPRGTHRSAVSNNLLNPTRSCQNLMRNVGIVFASASTLDSRALMWIIQFSSVWTNKRQQLYL